MGMSCSGVVVWCDLSSLCLAGLWDGWVLHPSALGLSQLVFPSPSYHTGTYDRAPSLFPPAPHLPPAAKPIGSKRMRWEQTPALRDLQTTLHFLGFSKPDLLEIPPSAAARALEGREDGGLCPQGVQDGAEAPGPSGPVPSGGRVT